MKHSSNPVVYKIALTTTCVVATVCLLIAQQSAAIITAWAPSMFSKISNYSNSTCAVADGKAYCWGRNNLGQLGNGTTADAFMPKPVDSTGGLAGKRVTDIAVGATGFACALASGSVYCWGNNAYGQLGNNSTTSSNIPVAVTTSGALAGRTVTSISVGDGHVCAIANSAAYCWGAGGSGRLGNNSQAQSNVPVAVNTAGVLNAKIVTNISAGSGHSCVIASAVLYCWGDNASGQLGNNSLTASFVPVAVDTTGVLSGKTPTSIDVGNNSSCAVAAGAAYCWGDNTVGQLGNGNTTASSVPVASLTSGVLSGKTLTQISEGNYNTCALDSAGAGYCWGNFATGGAPATSSTPVAVSTSGVLSGATLKYIEAGQSNCAIDANNRAYCWGINSYGELGNNSTAATSAPVAILADVPASQTAYRVSQNANSLTPGAPLAATNTAAQLTTTGQGFRVRTGVETTPSPGAAQALSSSQRTACTLLNGLPYCWGAGANGQIGNNGTADADVLAAVATSGVLAGRIPSSISAGGGHSCSIASSQVYCWGLNTNGQLGNNSTTQSNVPVAVSTSGVLASKTVRNIAVGASHTCAVASDNLAYCWGLNSTGQLGNNSTTQSNVPVAVNATGVLASKTILQVSTGLAETCAVASDNLAYCWGNNANGQLGNNSVTQSNNPVAVTATGVLSGKTVRNIAAGASHTCAIASDNLAYCWGLNANGQLGDNSVTQRRVPVAVNTAGVLASKTILQIAPGTGHTCAVASDGKVYCWGLNTNGQLGNNSTAQSNVPVAVNTTGVLAGKTIVAVATGQSYSCALASDQNMYCWGLNQNGRLGNGSLVDSSVPVLVTPSMQTQPVAANSDSYKLQYAQKTAATCSIQTGFADVTTTTPIAWNTNGGAAHGTAITTTANDPTSGATTTAQSYISAPGVFSNPTQIQKGNSGLWDFSLKDNGAPEGTSYCLKMVYGNGSDIQSYSSYPEIRTAGVLSVSIVDAAGSVVSAPTYSFNTILALGTCQTTSTTFGTSSQRIRVGNTSASPGWSLSVAPTIGATATWTRSDAAAKYDFNDPSGSPAGCNSGSDGDGYAGQLGVDPSAMAVAPQAGCTATGISTASSSAFNQGVTDAISLGMSSSGSPTNCYWDMTNVGLSQKIPPSQAPGQYALDMTVTVVAQ